MRGRDGTKGDGGHSMICPRCNKKVSFYKQYERWYCHSCQMWLEEELLNPQQPPSGTSIATWENKYIAAMLGILTSIIGFVLIFPLLSFLTLWPVIGFIILFWGCALPVIGASLILLNNFKIGGYIQIAGSALWIPIGFIGIYGGLMALKFSEPKQ